MLTFDETLTINGSLEKTFLKLINENNALVEQDVARYLPIVGFIIELFLEIAGIFLVYFLINLLAPIVVGEGYNNNFLYSMLLIPTINSLKKFPEIARSIFVKVAISNEYIICKRGYFRKFIDKLYIKNIDNIEIRTTIWGEWFNYGTIYLYSFGGKISLPYVKNPCKVYFLLKNKIDNKKYYHDFSNYN